MCLKILLSKFFSQFYILLKIFLHKIFSVIEELRGMVVPLKADLYLCLDIRQERGHGLMKSLMKEVRRWKELIRFWKTRQLCVIRLVVVVSKYLELLIHMESLRAIVIYDSQLMIPLTFEAWLAVLITLSVVKVSFKFLLKCSYLYLSVSAL